MGARAWTLCALVYAAVTAILGRDVLAQIGTTIANDPGDPLLTAAILHWNAHHVPFSQAWWNFPIFHPLADTLTFSEHLLGISVVATPIAWMTANPLATYNVTLLLTFPLCGLAMCALVYRLTRSTAGAFLAGLAYAFAPYRLSSLPHIQMLAAFWAPIALLGLHAFVETGRHRWLVVYGAAWLLQVSSNAYTLVLFSALVGLWVAWFVVARRNWRALLSIGAATAVAAVPLAPIVYKYVTVHALYGFERSVSEMRAYSADVAAVLCAPAQSTFWSWLRVACRPEGELFPGVASLALFAAALVSQLRVPAGHSPLTAVIRVLAAVSILFAAIVASVAVVGPWQIEALGLSASDVDKPLLVSLAAAMFALLLALGRRAASAPPVAFYAFAALVMWLLALGPTITLMGEQSGRPGLFALLQSVPGVDGLRVPARFWLMAVLCLALVAGAFAADLLKRLAAPMRATALLVLTLVLLADGWGAPIPAHSPPAAVPDPAALRGNVVMQLPIDAYRDIASTWLAVTGGWRTVNGYSGYAPNYYEALRLASEAGDDATFASFVGERELHVVVGNDAELRQLVERQPGAVVVAQAQGATQYRLPRRRPPPAAAAGAPVPIAEARAACNADHVMLMFDGRDDTAWLCLERAGSEVVTLDLGRPVTVGVLVYSLGRQFWYAPTALRIVTSLDGAAWTDAHTGPVLGAFIEGGLADPRSLRAVLPFPPRQARYVRIGPLAQPREFAWLVAELELRAPPAAD